MLIGFRFSLVVGQCDVDSGIDCSWPRRFRVIISREDFSTSVGKERLLGTIGIGSLIGWALLASG